MHRQVFSHLQYSRALSHVMVTGESNAITLKVFCFLLLSPAFDAQHCVTWHVPLVSCFGCVPSHPLAHLQPTHCQESMKNREGLRL